jgi:uncharacterized protein with HEPN domain
VLKTRLKKEGSQLATNCSQLKMQSADGKFEHARRIIGLRNQIIHGYDSISYENIWGIKMNHLPNLEIEIYRLIQE